MYPRTVHKPTFKPSRKKTTEYPKPWKRTTRLFQGHTIPHGLRLGILSNAGNHWFLHGWITPVLGHRYGGQCNYYSDAHRVGYELEPSGLTGLTIITSSRVGYDFCCSSSWIWDAQQGWYQICYAQQGWQQQAHPGDTDLPKWLQLQ